MTASITGKKREFEEIVTIPASSLRNARNYIDRTFKELTSPADTADATKKLRAEESVVKLSSHEAIINTALDILTSYPSLLRKDEKHKELKGIVQALEGNLTPEYRLFSRIVNNPIVKVFLGETDEIEFLSPEFILHSDQARAKWKSPLNASSLDLWYPNEIKVQEVEEKIKPFITDPGKYEGSDLVDDLIHHLAFFDYFRMEPLMECAAQKIIEKIDALPSDSLDQTTTIVNILNSSYLQAYPQLKNQLEVKISSLLIKVFSDCSLPELPAILDALKNLESLDVLDLSGSDVSDLDIAILAHLPLKELHLRHCSSLTSDCISTLSRFTQLQKVSLPNNKWVTDQVVECLPQSLKMLDLQSTALTDAAAPHFARLTNLEELHCWGTEVGDAIVQHLPPSLKKLIFCVSDAAAPHFARLTNLEELDLSFNYVGDAIVQYLPQSLIKLDLSGTGVTDAAASHFARLTKLVELDLSSVEVEDASVGDAIVQHLPPSLKKLALSGTGVTDAAASHFARLTKLEELDLSCTNVGDAIVQHLPRSLKKLNLGNSNHRAFIKLDIVDIDWKYQTQVTDAAAPHFACLTKLEVLDLSATWVGVKTVEKLPPLLKELNLSKVVGYYPEVPEIFDFAHLTRLERLDLSCAEVDDATVENLPLSLKELYLGKTLVSDEAASHFARLTNLERLDLEGTRVGNSTVENLPLSLKELYLGETNVTDVAAPHFARLTNLIELHIQGTKVGDAIVKHLPHSLK